MFCFVYITFFLCLISNRLIFLPLLEIVEYLYLGVFKYRGETRHIVSLLKRNCNKFAVFLTDFDVIMNLCEIPSVLLKILIHFEKIKDYCRMNDIRQ